MIYIKRTATFVSTER